MRSGVDAFTQLGYIDKLHFQGDLVCGYRPGASAGCLNRTAAMANSWRYTQSFASEKFRATSDWSPFFPRRTTGDIRNNFSYIMKNIVQSNAYNRFGGPHHWNDPDLLVVGNPGTSVDEQITQ